MDAIGQTGVEGNAPVSVCWQVRKGIKSRGLQLFSSATCSTFCLHYTPTYIVRICIRTLIWLNAQRALYSVYSGKKGTHSTFYYRGSWFISRGFALFFFFRFSRCVVIFFLFSTCSFLYFRFVSFFFFFLLVSPPNSIAISRFHLNSLCLQFGTAGGAARASERYCIRRAIRRTNPFPRSASYIRYGCRNV